MRLAQARTHVHTPTMHPLGFYSRCKAAGSRKKVVGGEQEGGMLPCCCVSLLSLRADGGGRARAKLSVASAAARRQRETLRTHTHTHTLPPSRTRRLSHSGRSVRGRSWESSRRANPLLAASPAKPGPVICRSAQLVWQTPSLALHSRSLTKAVIGAKSSEIPPPSESLCVQIMPERFYVASLAKDIGNTVVSGW